MSETREAKHCPFCGKGVDFEDEDTLYPTGAYWREEDGIRHYFRRSASRPGDGRVWGMHCPTPAGGCGAEIRGDSEEEALEKWNRRAAVSEQTGLLVAEAANAREECAQLLEISTAELLLLAGEMTAQELRTVKAVLAQRARAIRALETPSDRLDAATRKQS